MNPMQAHVGGCRARYVVIAVSAFRLFKWPFGTLFGAYSLWVLLNDETRDIFNSSL